MRQYSRSKELDDLLSIGMSILSKAESDLDRKKVLPVVRMYSILQSAERDVIEQNPSDANSGELSRVYNSLCKGIYEIAKQHRVAGDLYVLSRSSAYSGSNWNWLIRYVKEDRK